MTLHFAQLLDELCLHQWAALTASFKLESFLVLCGSDVNMQLYLNE